MKALLLFISFFLLGNSCLDFDPDYEDTFSSNCGWNCEFEGVCYKSGDQHPQNCTTCLPYMGWVSSRGCCIYGVLYSNNTINPKDDCEVCSVPIHGPQQVSHWSPRPGCCIDGAFFAPGDVNPENECEWCQVPPDQDTAVQVSYWTSREAGVPCATGHCDGDGNCAE